MTRRAAIQLVGACIALAFATGAAAQTKKELVQKILQNQQAEIESVALSIVQRPAAQMMREAGLAMQRQIAPDKREAMGKAIEAEVKKYTDEAYPLVRERALRLAPSILGAALEEKMTEDELKQLLAWLESTTYKKFQQLGESRNAFVQKVLAESVVAVDPKVAALDGKIRVILGVPAAAPASAASATSSARPTAPAARASGK